MQDTPQSSEYVVTVQVSLPNVDANAGSKAVDSQDYALDVGLAAVTELDFGPPTPPSESPSCSSCSSCLQCSCSNELLLLFLLGWLFLPLWWAGAVMGFLRGRRSLTGTHRAAWRGCMVMSVVGTALLLAFAIHYGPGESYPDGLQEYYFALSGPTAALPDLHSNANQARFATALHTTLELPQSYPATNIVTRLVEAAPTAATPAGAGRRILLSSLQETLAGTNTPVTVHLASNPAPACKEFFLKGLNPLVLAAARRTARRTRRLLQETVSPASAVLGVKFTPGPGLPSDEVLAALLSRSSAMTDFAEELAAVDFVAVPEDIKIALSDSNG